jgi:hypothetical protein
MTKILQFDSKKYFDFSELFEAEGAENLPHLENAAILARAAQKFNEKIKLPTFENALDTGQSAGSSKKQGLTLCHAKKL